MSSEQYPKLLKVQSEVIRCNGCHAWVIRVPQFTGFEDDWQCERCGCTSTISQIGRPFAPKSRSWESIVAEFRWWWDYSDGFSPEVRNEMLIGCEYESVKQKVVSS